MHRSILKEFTDKLVAATRNLKIGDPVDDDTRIGATMSKSHAEKVLGYIDSAVKEVFPGTFPIDKLNNGTGQ